MMLQKFTRRRALQAGATLAAAAVLPALPALAVERVGLPAAVDLSLLVPCDPAALAGRDAIAEQFMREGAMEPDLALWLGTLVMETKCSDRADAALARVVLRDCADLANGRLVLPEHQPERAMRARWMRRVDAELGGSPAA